MIVNQVDAAEYRQPRSELEELLLGQIRQVRMPAPEREYRFARPRQWRFDLAYPHHTPPIAIEVEGGQWVGGRHQRGKGFEDDCEKYAHAALLGWIVLRVTTNMVQDGRALQLIERARGIATVAGEAARVGGRQEEEG